MTEGNWDNDIIGGEREREKRGRERERERGRENQKVEVTPHCLFLTLRFLCLDTCKGIAAAAVFNDARDLPSAGGPHARHLSSGEDNMSL